jgi:aminoglycoside phosphotransferase (APT) family kinase protein
MDLLQSELAKLVIADPSTEVARNASMLATTQLRRLLVDQREVPQLRMVALNSYRELLPGLQHVLDTQVFNELSQVLTDAVSANWVRVETALRSITTTLIAKNDPTATRLAGQLVSIDAQLRDSKEAACTEANKTREPRSGSKTVGSNSVDEEARLLTFLQREFPKESALTITRIEQIPGGYSKDTLFVYLDNTTELPNCVVMRRDGPYPGTSVITEYPIITKMHTAGVAVPQPYAIDATGEVYGKPFILVSRAAGSMIGDFVIIKEPTEAVALDLARKMACLHTAPFDGIHDYLVGGQTPIIERLQAEIDTCEATWNSVVHQRSYVVHAALEWLKRNIHRADGPRTILHRDIGFHNMMVHNNEVSAFLDWETAAVGTAAEDVGYTYDSVCQMTEWDTFIKTYESAANVQLDRSQLDFYILWGSVRIVVPISKGVDPVFAGRRKNLSEYYLGDHIVAVLIQRIAHQLTRVLSQN